MSKKIFKAPQISAKRKAEIAKDKMYESTYDDRQRIRISEKDIPEIASWEVGESYKIEATIMMKSKTLDTNAGENQNKHDADFIITAISVDSD